MTAQDLLIQEIEFTAKQVEIAIAGLDETQLDSKATDTSMSIREILVHLCDTYSAFLAKADGKQYDWGSLRIENNSGENLIRAFRELRAKAVECVAQGIPEDMLLIAFEFMPQHDSYHVGQICAARIGFDPDFDPYSLYH